MKRKNLFLIPALFLISTLCLINVSCFSGFQEKGEVTVTFSESTLRHIMARGADISEEQEDFDLSDLIPDSEEYKDFIALYQIMQNKPMEIFAGSTKSSILSAEDVTCALMIYESGDYLLISREAFEAMSEIKPGNLEEISSMMRFSTGLFISKGKYTENEGTIYINEEAYYDSSTKEWIKLESASRIGDVPTNNTYFTVLSNSGIRYYFVSEDYFGDDWTDIPDVDPYEDEQADSATLSVKLVAGNMSYEKTFTVYSNTKKAHVEFTDIPVGVTAKVIALVYFDDPDEGRLTYAKGESEEFVINPGSNYAKIKLREYYGGDEPPSGVPEAIIEGKGLYDEHGGSNNRQYLLAFYRNGMYAVYEYDSIPKIVDIDDSDEILAVLESGLLISYGTYTSTNEKFKYTETVCYDFSNRTYKKGTASGDWTLPFVTIDFATGSGVMVRFYNNGNEYENKISYSAYGSLPEQYWKTFNGGILYFNALSDGTYSIFANVYGDDLQYKENKYFAKGTWELVEAEGASASLRLIETEYYDFDSDGLVSGGNKVTVVDLSKTSFSYNGSTGIELEFNLNVEPSSYPFTFIINGFDKNDVTDLDGNECNVTLYAIKDASVMSTIKSTLANEKLSDDAKAEILVPIIEGALNYSITAFQPGINYSSHSDAPTSEVLDDGTIKWSGTGLTPLSEGTTYGVLATVYFSQNYSSGYYEFDIGYAENLTLSSDSNEVELTVSAMDIPCKIQFYHDDDYDSQYTVTTAMSEIMMFDEDNNIRESVLNELWAAAEESVNALAEKNYEYDSNSIPVCGMQNGVPFVTLYYISKNPASETTDTVISVTLDEIDTTNAGELSFTSATYIINAYDDEKSYYGTTYVFTPNVEADSYTWFLDDIALDSSNLTYLTNLYHFNQVTAISYAADGTETESNIQIDDSGKILYMNFNELNADAMNLTSGSYHTLTLIAVINDKSYSVSQRVTVMVND